MHRGSLKGIINICDSFESKTHEALIPKMFEDELSNESPSSA